MTRVLILAGALGLAASQAMACDFMRSASAKVDDTKVASITTDEQKNMSTPVVQQAPAADDTAKTAVPALSE